MKIDINKVDLTNNNQKVIAGLLVIGVLALLYFVLPPLAFILKSLWTILLLGVPLVILVAFVVYNPMLIWNIFKQLSWNLTKALIAGDKLGYMYRYHEYIISRIGELKKSLDGLGAIKAEMNRTAINLAKQLEENKKMAVAYEGRKTERNAKEVDSAIRQLAIKIKVDTTQLDQLTPRIDLIQKQYAYLDELHGYWIEDAESLKYTLDAKAAEYEMYQRVAKATDAAAEFLKQDTEQARIYKESLDQIETEVTTYISNIESFEKQAKPIIQAMSLNKEVNEEEGLKLLEEYKKSKPDFKAA